VALSMDEQRILDEMERNLAADDPRLASRLGSFGQQRRPGTIRSQHARTIGGVLALALIAAVTVMMFVISPFANHAFQHGPGKVGTSHATSSQGASTGKAKSSTTASAPGG
jgi:hypothetical protein